MSESTDRDLAARCAGGEARAWRELLARHDRRILLVLGRTLGRAGAADLLDLRQEVYARLLSRRGAALRTLRAERPGALAAFLSRVALRVALDHARACEVRLDLSAGGQGAGGMGASAAWEGGAAAAGRAGLDLPASGHSPEQAALARQARSLLWAALERDCDGLHAGRDRVVLRAHFGDGLTAAEIARLGCGLSAKGVETVLRRARLRLRRHLAPPT